MGKKMKFPFLSKTPEATTSWPWPSCGSPKTLSFRAAGGGGDGDGDVFKTLNSAYGGMVDTTAESWLTNSSKTGTFSAELEASGGGGESIEAVICGLRSAERLFFEPGETSSILEEAKSDGFPFKESLVTAMDSENPYLDFKRSMEEMVEAHGLKDWEGLEELLSWYLRVNGKKNHGYIVGAFVDLLAGLAFASSSSSSLSSSEHDQSSSTTGAHSPISPLSFSSSTSSTSPCLSSLEAEDEVEKKVDNGSFSDA